MTRQPPTSLTGDTPNHGVQRLQKTNKFPRSYGYTGIWEYGREPKISVLKFKGTSGQKGDARWSLECAGSSATGSLI